MTLSATVDGGLLAAADLIEQRGHTQATVHATEDLATAGEDGALTFLGALQLAFFGTAHPYAAVYGNDGQRDLYWQAVSAVEWYAGRHLDSLDWDVRDTAEAVATLRVAAGRFTDEVRHSSGFGRAAA